MNTHIIQGSAELFSFTDFNESDSKSLLDRLYKYFHENVEEPPCSTCDKLILKLSKHVRDIHAPPQGENTLQSVATEIKRNLRSKRRVNYSEHVENSIPVSKLPKKSKNLKTPCNVDVVPVPSTSVASTFASADFSATDITNPEVKIEDLDLDMDMDFPDYPVFGGSDEEETKIDINYLTGGNIVTTTIAPGNSTVIASSKEKRKKLAKPCTICKKKFSTTIKLNLHLQKSHPGERSYTCRITNCGKEFLNEYLLRAHQKLHTKEKPFSCDVCGNSFSQALYLKRHKSIHSRPFICDVCGKCCGRKDELEVHKRAKHTGEKPFTCTICGKKFSGSRHLNIHVTTVHGDEEFVCEVCGKSFKSKMSLSAHTITHSGQNSFVCGVCGKSFRTRRNLVAHQLIHTGVRAFTCDICPKTFKDKGQLVKHTRTHTGEKPFSCELCNKYFSTKKNLNDHQGSHSDARPFVCQICHTAFKWSKHLKRHRKQVHSSENS